MIYESKIYAVSPIWLAWMCISSRLSYEQYIKVQAIVHTCNQCTGEYKPVTSALYTSLVTEQIAFKELKIERDTLNINFAVFWEEHIGYLCSLIRVLSSDTRSVCTETIFWQSMLPELKENYITESSSLCKNVTDACWITALIEEVNDVR